MLCNSYIKYSPCLRNAGHVDHVTPPTPEQEALRLTGEPGPLDSDAGTGVPVRVVQPPALLDHKLPGAGAEGGLHGDVAHTRQPAPAVEALGAALGPVNEGVEDDEHAGADLFPEGPAGGGRQDVGDPQLLERPDVGSVQVWSNNLAHYHDCKHM